MRRILDSWKSNSAPWAVFSAIFCISILKLFYKDAFGDPILFGFAAYFLVVACFVFFGSRVRPSSSITQVSAALSIGILVWIFADIFFKPKDKAPDVAQFVCDVGGKFSPKNNTTTSLSFFCRPRGSEKNDADAPENPFEKINVFAAVLAAVLTALTFIAQKSAGEARAEAERAQQLLTSAWDVRLASFLGQVALEAQRIKNGEVSNLDKNASFESAVPELAGLHMRWAEVLNALNHLLVDLLHAVAEDRIDELNVPVNNVEVHVKGLAKAHRDFATSASIELLHDQSRRYVAPLRQLLQRSVDVLGGGAFDGIAAENVRKLTEVMRRLNRILRELG